MRSSNQTQLLRDEAIRPVDSVLKQALGKGLFAVYQELMDSIKKEFDLNPEWRFYRDGKAWLCKITDRKKTILWLSIWENLIKVSFYFTEKTRTGAMGLNIEKRIKDDFSKSKPIGKLIPLVVDVERSEQLIDLKALIAYKKGLK